MDFITLSNGVKMPLVGYGSLRVGDGNNERCILEALEVGYRAVDTAQYYMNEADVGRAIKKSGVPREEIFLTTKVWISNVREKTLPSIEASLKNLQTDYVDLLLIHEPYNDYYSIWRGIEEAYRQGKARAIGVCNFYPDRLTDFCRCVDIKPQVMQMEVHVFQQQKIEREYLKQYNIALEAWGPLVRGKNNIFSNPVLKKIAVRHDRTVGQIALKFLIQNGIAIIPKSSHKERMAENLNLFDFELSVEDLAAIEALDTGKNVIFDHRDPVAMEAIFGNENADAWENP